MCATFLLGRVVNAASASRGIRQALADILWLPGRPLNLLSWLAIALPPIATVTKRWLEQRLRDPVLYEEYLHIQNRFIPIQFRHLFHGTVAWGPCCTLQMAPFLREGWGCGDIRIELEPRKYRFPPERRHDFTAYYAGLKERFASDRPKFALAKKPFSLTDDPQLRLRVIETRFSQVQYFKDCVAGVTAERDKYASRALDEEVGFPNAFCLHLIVVTSDNALLLTHRSPKLIYNPDVWSFSIEEQLATEDVKMPPKQIFRTWSQRLLREELGITDQDIEALLSKIAGNRHLDRS